MNLTISPYFYIFNFPAFSKTFEGIFMNMGNNIRDLFFGYFTKMALKSRMHEDTMITPENIYQPAHKANRDIFLEALGHLHLPGSTIIGEENLIKLYELAKQGHSCIILSEHVSNLDVPSMFRRFYDSPNDKLKEIFEKIIFIAGVKLNENSMVKLYTEMFTRIVIFPARSLSEITGKDEHKEEVDLARKINIRATRKIKELRTQGNIFVMYPAGTRYRPWMPETKKGIKETTSYLNSFDYFCCGAINGNNMPPEAHGDMMMEQIVKDVMVYSFSEVKSTKDYINSIASKGSYGSVSDKEIMKQAVVDKIMEDIDALHSKAEEYRSQHLNK
jgi:glycerol-3-phosphate O-acyltransferase